MANYTSDLQKPHASVHLMQDILVYLLYIYIILKDPGGSMS